MKRGGFNIIELVFVIIIIGVLSAVAIPKLVMSREDACYAKLRTNLAETQSTLSREYTKRFMQGTRISDAEVVNILKTGLDSNTDNRCQFIVNNANNISAKIGKTTLNMIMTTDPLTKTLTITCDLNNKTCQKLTGKKTTN